MNIWNERNWKPMLLHEIDKPFSSEYYLFEIKYDGIRACIFTGNNDFYVKTRNNVDVTNIFPELKSIQGLVKENTILDGEIVYMEKNKPSFTKLMTRMRLKNKMNIEYESINNPVIFVAFDILYKDKDITDKKLIDRKKILDKIKENDVLIKSKVYMNDGIKLFNLIKKHNLEGIVAKKIDSTYEVNTRSYNWIKIKNFKENIFFIGGYEVKKNNYISVLLGEKRNNKLYFVGKGSIKNNNDLYDKVLSSKKISSKFQDLNDNKYIYVSPIIKCNVSYLERTKNNHLRQPIIRK